MCHGISYNKKPISNNYFTYLKRNVFKFISICLIFAVFVIIGLFNCDGGVAFAESNGGDEIETQIEDGVDKMLSDSDFSEIDNICEELNFGDIELFGGDFKNFLYRLIVEGEIISFDNILNIIKSDFVKLAKEILSPLLLIFVIICLCNLLNLFGNGKLNNSISDIIYFLCMCVIIVILSVIIKDVIIVSKEALLSIQKQANVVMPVLLSFMSIVGAVSSVAVYSPMLAVFSSTVMNVFLNILMPIFTAILLLVIVSKISKNNKLAGVSDFLTSMFKWIMGTVTALFMTFLSFQGITASFKDGISIKAAKFAIKNYVPILGGYISDGFEIVKAGSVLIKNGVGIAGILILFLTILKPVCYLVILSLGLKLVSGVTGIVDNIKISSMLANISNVLKLLIAIIVGVTCLYFFVLFLCICTGNAIV